MQGTYCNQCHNSPGASTAPTVSIEALGGDLDVFPGQKKAFTFIIERTSESHIKCGFNVAADDGTLSAESPNIRKQSGELTHTAPWGYDDSSDLCIFPFHWTAPDELGTYTLYAAGNSVNGNSGNGDNEGAKGDFPATTTVEVEVVAGGDGDDDDDDSGDDDDDDSGDDDDDDSSGDDDDDNTGSTGTNGSESGPKNAGGCSTTGMASCSLLVGLLFALGLVRKRRRRKF
jgi:hypothetical protein